MKQSNFDLEQVSKAVANIDLLGNAVLVRATAKISTLALTALSKGDMDNSILKSFYNELSQADKIIVKVSDTSIYKEKLIVGKRVIYSEYGQAKPITNKDDEYDLDNVIEAFSIDSKDKQLAKNVGIKYLCHGYYIIDAQFVLAVNSL